MAKQIKARRVATARTSAIGPRELVLAGLGAVSLTRKQSIRLFDAIRQEGAQLSSRLGQASVALNDRIYAARDSIGGVVAPAVERAGNALASARGEIEQRLAPVLVRLGVKPAAKTRKRSTAKRPAARRTSRARKSA